MYIHVVCFLLGNSPASEVYMHIMHNYSIMYAYNLQTPVNYPKESIQHLEHGESLKSSIFINFCDQFDARSFLFCNMYITLPPQLGSH
jgi:acetyl-CoA carboxylase carboxyltransferase component